MKPAREPFDLRLKVGHRNRVSRIVFSRDGRHVATAGDDRLVKLWDAGTGEVLATLETESPERPCALVFIAGGTVLASLILPWDREGLADWDWGVRMWEVPGGTRIREAPTALRREVQKFLGNDGDIWVEVGTRSDQQAIIDWRTGRALGRMPEGWTSNWALSPDRRSVAIAEAKDDGPLTVRIGSVAKGTEIRRWTVPGRFAGPTSLAFSPDGLCLAVGTYGGTVLLLDEACRGLLWMHKAHGNDPVDVLAFSPDGRVLASGCDDHIVVLTDVASGRLVRRLGASGNDARCLEVSSDGALLASGHLDGAARTWDARTGSLRSVFPGHAEGVVSLALSPEGRSLATVDGNGLLRVWDAHSPTIRRLLYSLAPRWDIERYQSVAFFPDGRRIVAAGRERLADGYMGVLRVWDVHSGEVLWTGKVHGDAPKYACGDIWEVDNAAVSPDGHLVAGSVAHEIWLWDAGSGELLRRILRPEAQKMRFGISSLTFSPDGRWLAVGNNYEMGLFSIERDRFELELESGEMPWSSSFSPDGTLLAAACIYDPLEVHDLRSGTRNRTFPHRNRATAVRFSPVKTRMYTASEDGAIRAWNPRTGRLLLTMLPLPAREEGGASTDWVAFNPRGLVSSSEGARRWISGDATTRA